MIDSVVVLLNSIDSTLNTLGIVAVIAGLAVCTIGVWLARERESKP